MPSPTEISVKQLSRLVGTPGCPVLWDVRLDEDFVEDPRLMPGAQRISMHEAETCGAGLDHVVVSCHRGGKISQGVAALLRDRGVRAETLAGGHCDWRDAGELLVPQAQIPAPGVRTLWVTRHRPKVDRIACPWLLRRFVDRQARFLFVAPSEVLAVAERFGAIPFDTEGVPWSHRGDLCTFDVMVQAFALESAPLLRLATIVRGADTNRHDLAPESAGLLAASLGLSRIHKDDLAQLEAGFALYDSFYRWARDATGETHDWPPG